MAVDHKVTLTQAVERELTCPRCGAHGDATFNAIGEGGWARESVVADMFNTDSAQERSAQDAASDLVLDADRIVGLLRCPACKQRAPGALRWPAIRVAVPLVIAALLPFVSWILGWGSLVFVVGALVVFSRERRRLERADHVTIKNLERGAKTKATFATKPVHRPPPKVVVVAPVIEKPRGPDEGPAFLTERKP